jgi:hypothetical protein
LRDVRDGLPAWVAEVPFDRVPAIGTLYGVVSEILIGIALLAVAPRLANRDPQPELAPA